MPSIQDRDVLWVKRFSSFQRGEVALLYPPKNAPQSMSVLGTRVRFVKRILGIPGDRLWMSKGRFWLNGKLLEESYTLPYWIKQDNWDNISYLANSNDWVFWKTADPNPCNTSNPNCKPRSILLKSDEYFVVGDNRSPGGSEDSRVFGAVEKADMLGTVQWIGFLPKSLEIPQELK
jgi:signal peptidase I